MGKPTKSVSEKLETRLKRISLDSRLTRSGKKLLLDGKPYITYTSTQFRYSNKRYYPSKVDYLSIEDYSVTVLLNHKNLKFISSHNPPAGAKIIFNLISKTSSKTIKKIILGTDKNELKSGSVYITNELYNSILKINTEENVDKSIRFMSRTQPFLKNHFDYEPNIEKLEIDYSLLLKEVIESGEFTQEDILKLTNKLLSGEKNDIVIETQVKKQVKWLIETIEEIIEEPVLNKDKAKELGKEHFDFPKYTISGPEELMEKILTKFGQSTLFGVPVLLNTNKYVVSPRKTRSQFDLILIDHLADVELIELKTPDAVVLEFDPSRGKFFPSKNLSVAIGQAERYISTIQKDNDEDYKIGGKKIKDFINSQIGDTLTVEICRPQATIIIGRYSSLYKDYTKLSAKYKKKFRKADYLNNGLQAYKELKNSFRNIKILTYSELLENARTRLELSRGNRII